MKTAALRKPVGCATFERLRTVRFHSWEDQFEVEFDSGISYLVSNTYLRRRNHLGDADSPVAAVWVDPELRSGFFVRYENGEIAEASWEFVKEQP